MAVQSVSKSTLYCSFCGKSQHEVRKLIAGPTIFICDECVELCIDIIREENKSSVKSRDGIPTPKEISKVLDDYVIRQNHAMTLLVAYQLAYRKQKTLPSAWRPALPLRRGSPAAGPFPPGDRPPPSQGLIGDGAGSDGHGSSLDRGNPILEHKTNGEFARRSLIISFLPRLPGCTRNGAIACLQILSASRRVSRTQYGIRQTAAPGRDLVLERPPRHGPASQGDRRNGRNRHPYGCWRRRGEWGAGRD